VILLATFVRHALHARNPLVDLRLFLNRTFTTASVTLVLMVISVFGAMLLLPLYFQAVRGESALQSGLLLAPQGLGAMLMMPLAGNLTDKTGIGKIVIPGLVLVVVSTLWLTGLSGDTSYWALSAALFVMGMGMGLAMMPLFSGAMQTLRKAAVARASTTLNIIQQVGASIGTAVMSVLLVSALKDRLPGAPSGGGLGQSGKNLPAHIRDLMADGFGHTYIWATLLVIVAVAAAFFLPRTKPEPIEDDEETGGEDTAPVLIHA
jgi:MFS family permease